MKYIHEYKVEQQLPISLEKAWEFFSSPANLSLITPPEMEFKILTKDLKKEIAAGNFREDLYHRLSVIVIKVPSLNERKDDLPLLAEHFLQQIADEYGQPKKNINAAALKALQQHDWTGNIREFRNVIERLIILSGETIDEKAVKQYATPYFN